MFMIIRGMDLNGIGKRSSIIGGIYIIGDQKYPVKGSPNLYLEDIYQYKIGVKMDIMHYICTPLA